MTTNPDPKSKSTPKTDEETKPGVPAAEGLDTEAEAPNSEATTVEASSTEVVVEAASDAKAPSKDVEVTVEAASEEAPTVEAETPKETKETKETDAKASADADSAAKTSTKEKAAASDKEAAAEQSEAVESDERLKATVKAGQRIEVKLIQVGDKESFVDFGGAAEGTITSAELKDAKGELRVNVGETFTAIVRKFGEPVEFTVGRGKGGDTLRMRELQSAHEGKIPVEGKIKSTNKGGFEIDLNGVRAFCPFSQIDVAYCEKPEDHVGSTYTFEIIAFERGGRNIVLSRRRILEQEAKGAAGETREKLAVGETFEGVVRRLQPYGAFIDIGGVDGLVHVSEISRRHIADPREVLKVGQRVSVKVIGLDDLGGKQERISLSMKELENDPWEGAAEKWAPGSIVPGKVVRLTEFGAFIELSPGVDGLVHVSEISTERIDHPSSVLEPEQTVEVRILGVDPESRRISLTMRPEGEDRPQRAPRPDSGERRGGGGRPRKPRERDDRQLESYSFSSDEEKKEPDVNVGELEYTDALELLKQKFNQE